MPSAKLNGMENRSINNKINHSLTCSMDNVGHEAHKRANSSWSEGWDTAELSDTFTDYCTSPELQRRCIHSGKELVLLDVGFGDRARPKNIGVRLLFQLSDTCCSGSDRTGKSIFCLSFIRSREIQFKTSRTSIQVKPGGKSCRLET